MFHEMPVTAPSSTTVPKPRHSPWSAFRVALVVIAGLFVSVGLHLKATHNKAISDAETLIGALAVASEQHIGGSLAGIDQLLDELAATVREGRHEDPQFQADLAARLPSFPEVRYIGIISADGVLLPQTWPPQPFIPPEGIPVGDRRYFTAQRDATGPSAMVVGDPVISRASNQRTLHLSRPIHDRNGRFAGVVSAAVNPDVYATFLSSIVFDEAGSCGLISLDGRMIARAPNHEAEFGRDISDSDLIRIWAPRNPTAVAHLIAKTDGNDKLLAYRVMPEYALMVTAGMSRDRALGEWRRMAAAELTLLAVFSVLLLYWASRIQRHEGILSQQQRLMEEAVGQRSRELEQARALAENRAAWLGWINGELKRLTLVASHHLQEPLRSVVSCGQMIPRSLSPCPPELQRAVDTLGNQGLSLKEQLSEFERHVAALTGAMQLQTEDAGVPTPETPANNHSDRPVHTARAIAGAMIVLLLGAAAWQVRADYRASVQAAETLTTAVVNSIDHHLVASLRRIDHLLEDVALAVTEGRHTHAEFREHLLLRMGAVAEIRQISVADADGRVTPWAWTADGATVALPSVADRDFFRDQAQARGPAALAVGQPRRDDSQRLLHLSRPLTGPGGHFDGVVMAAVETDLYARFLETVLLDEDGGTAIITAKGRMVARAPRHEDKFGMDLADSELFTRHLPQAPSGVAHLVAKADGNSKLLGYHLLDGFPLVVTSGFSKRRALEQWKLAAAAGGALAAIASAILFAWAWRADRHARALARYRRELAAEVARRTAGLTATHRAVDRRSSRLAEANERMRELIRLIAADLQEPLHRLADSVTEVRALAAGRNEECDHWLGFIVAGDVHLRALVRDYQRFVATLSDTPQVVAVNSGEVARAAATETADLWRGRVEFRFGPLPELPADGKMLHELFLQLFTNAAIHAARHHPVTVEVAAEPQDGGWRFTVADNGTGLPPVNSEHLFRAFETAHGRDPDSTGLGLPLCRIIVEGHGGRIWATSRTGKGCDIHFILPANDADRFPLAGNPAPA